MNLDAPGVWFYPDGLTAPQTAEFAQRIEALGYSTLWLPEAGGRDPFVLASWVLANTERLVVATGIANIYARDPMAMRAAQYALAEQSGGRFLLGIGVSHAPLVEDVRGHVYGKPIASMRAYLERLAAAPYGAPIPEPTPPTLLAALGPRMLELARDAAAGAHPYLVPPEHTERARAILGPDRLLCTEQKVVYESEASKARAIARNSPAISFGLTLPNYRRNLMRLGYDDTDFSGEMSDRLIDAVVAWGNDQALAQRVRDHYDAGADHVCIHPLHPDNESVPDWRILEALAPTGN
ncbi:TIGR03620 family F420-dependent LLM class oxidoreductase [Myxococcota bacterium]|nr:TIGR03620 family F420-dependent LLM class oxidoreductase [Myxococcota bacterium]